MLFLLKDAEGRALLMAETRSKAEADQFGRAHLPNFCGESLEVDLSSREDAEEFWGVRTVRLLHIAAGPEPRRVGRPAATSVHLWVREPGSTGVAVDEDCRDVALDHIARTSDLVGEIEIVLWG